MQENVDVLKIKIPQSNPERLMSLNVGECLEMPAELNQYNVVRMAAYRLNTSTEMQFTIRKDKGTAKRYVWRLK